MSYTRITEPFKKIEKNWRLYSKLRVVKLEKYKHLFRFLISALKRPRETYLLSVIYTYGAYTEHTFICNLVMRGRNALFRHLFWEFLTKKMTYLHEFLTIHTYVCLRFLCE